MLLPLLHGSPYILRETLRLQQGLTHRQPSLHHHAVTESHEGPYPGTLQKIVPQRHPRHRETRLQEEQIQHGGVEDDVPVVGDEEILRLSLAVEVARAGDGGGEGGLVEQPRETGTDEEALEVKDRPHLLAQQRLTLRREVEAKGIGEVAKLLIPQQLHDGIMHLSVRKGAYGLEVRIGRTMVLIIRHI